MNKAGEVWVALQQFQTGLFREVGRVLITDTAQIMLLCRADAKAGAGGGLVTLTFIGLW